MILAAGLMAQPLFAGKKDATMQYIIATEMKESAGKPKRILAALGAERAIDESLEECMGRWNRKHNDMAYLDCVEEWSGEHPHAELTETYAQEWLRIRREKRNLWIKKNELIHEYSKSRFPRERNSHWQIDKFQRRWDRHILRDLRNVEKKLSQYP